MAPKAKKGGGKKKQAAAESVEPEHDLSWERAVISGLWDRPVSALPDANTWPSWGALRERILLACREIRVPGEPSVRDAFAAELVKLSPPSLRALNFSGCRNLRKLVLSPLGACPLLEELNLSSCPALEYLLLQSGSLHVVDVSSCGCLSKALIHCPRLQSLAITGCTRLDTLMLWSEELAELDLTGAEKVTQLELQCPALDQESSKLPAVPTAPRAVRPVHPPIASMLRERAREAAAAATEAREQQWKSSLPSCPIPKVFRAM